MYAQDSIELLKNSGIDFVSNEARGIDVHQFGAHLMTSGIVLNDEVTPNSFHIIKQDCMESFPQYTMAYKL